MIVINPKERKYKVHKRLFYLLISIFILSRTTYSDVPKTSDRQSSTFHKTNDAPEDLIIYEMHLRERQSVGFISLSDEYHYHDRPDWFAMPNIRHKKKKDAEYLILGLQYRNRLLSNTKISETDRVFIYDYSKDHLVSFLVKDLNAVACLDSYYIDINNYKKKGPIDQNNYQIGFAIDKNLLKGFGSKDFSGTLVFIGKKNPFNKGKVKPIRWKKMDLKEFPKIPMKPEHVSMFKGYTFGQTYQFESEGLKYYLQDIFKNEILSSREVTSRLHSRRLLVIKSKTKDLVFETFYSSHTGSIFIDLDSVGWRRQWTGRMFKNRPPVIFGFLSDSYKCEDIDFLKLSRSIIRIHCDNRG
ncbi:hypothetical protein E4413_04240 [Leptospira interrogans]|uniref:hypothetical protein n=1 Tax=Leptospira interrogans TaxID=173 RepID=UPI0010BFA192|nr:hypothetical protein [Leptospira interrogans]QCO40227.1 hypothetical protein E4413_04240 [Leptospira interrogans]